MNPFKQTGFDTTISKDVHIVADRVNINSGTFTLDGRIKAKSIVGAPDVVKSSRHAKLIVEKNGFIDADEVEVSDVVVMGRLDCKTLVVSGELAIHKGAHVFCETIKYNRLVIQTGARLTGHLHHINGPLVGTSPDPVIEKEPVSYGIKQI